MTTAQLTAAYAEYRAAVTEPFDFVSGNAPIAHPAQSAAALAGEMIANGGLTKALARATMDALNNEVDGIRREAFVLLAMAALEA
jgi:hypothetical protein